MGSWTRWRIASVSFERLHSLRLKRIRTVFLCALTTQWQTNFTCKYPAETYLNPLSSSMPLVTIPFLWPLTWSSFFNPFVSNGELSFSLSWFVCNRLNEIFDFQAKSMMNVSWTSIDHESFTLLLSSNLRERKRGSSPESGLSLFVGDPPNTYSTIFTPKPPVESRGLQ